MTSTTTTLATPAELTFSTNSLTASDALYLTAAPAIGDFHLEPLAAQLQAAAAVAAAAQLQVSAAPLLSAADMLGAAGCDADAAADFACVQPSQSLVLVPATGDDYLTSSGSGSGSGSGSSNSASVSSSFYYAAPTAAGGYLGVAPEQPIFDAWGAVPASAAALSPSPVMAMTMAPGQAYYVPYQMPPMAAAAAQAQPVLMGADYASLLAPAPMPLVPMLAGFWSSLAAQNHLLAADMPLPAGLGMMPPHLQHPATAGALLVPASPAFMAVGPTPTPTPTATATSPEPLAIGGTAPSTPAAPIAAVAAAVEHTPLAAPPKATASKLAKAKPAKGAKAAAAPARGKKRSAATAAIPTSDDPDSPSALASASGSGEDKEAAQARGKKMHWTVEEHQLFLVGLARFGKGRWRDISELLGSRTPEQTLAHAQRYFRRQKQVGKKNRSIHDLEMPLVAAPASSSPTPSQCATPRVADSDESE